MTSSSSKIKNPTRPQTKHGLTMRVRTLLVIAVACCCIGGGGTSPPKLEDTVHNPPMGPTLHKMLSKIYKNSTGTRSKKVGAGDINPVSFVPATRTSPSMICQKVEGQNGHSGLLCKALPVNSTESAMEKRAHAQKSLKVRRGMGRLDEIEPTCLPCWTG